MASRGVTLKCWLILSDGCGGESKNRYFIFMCHLMCVEFIFDYIIIVYAPTSCFKYICDSQGGVMKEFIAFQELSQIISHFATNEMDDKMKREDFVKYVHATVINSNGPQQTTAIVYNVDSRCYANLA